MGDALFLGANCHIRVFFFCAVSGLVDTVYDIHIHTRVIEFPSSTVLSVYRILYLPTPSNQVSVYLLQNENNDDKIYSRTHTKSLIPWMQNKIHLQKIRKGKRE
jgi:hypothetical protein